MKRIFQQAFLTLIILMILLTGGCKPISSSISSEPPQTNTLPPPAVLQPTSILTTEEWQHYRSETGGFEIDYPHDWEVSDEGKGEEVLVSFSSPEVIDEDQVVAAKVVILSSPSLESDGGCQRRDSHLSELYKDEVISSKEIVVDGMKAERVETETRIDLDIIIYTHFSSIDRNFCVRGSFPGTYNLDRLAPVYDKMLMSFRLLSKAKLNNGMRQTAGMLRSLQGSLLQLAPILVFVSSTKTEP